MFQDAEYIDELLEKSLTSRESSSEALPMASSSLVSLARLSLQAFLAASCLSSFSLQADHSSSESRHISTED